MHIRKKGHPQMPLSPRTKFVVLASQRSGSTWLIDVLDKVENTTAYGELFLPQRWVWTPGSTDYPQFIAIKPSAPAVRPFSVFAYLDDLYAKPGAVGFKLMYSQLRLYPEILAYCCRHRIRIVHFVRQNSLDVVISTELAAQTGQWHVLSGQPKPDPGRIYLNPKTLMREMRRLQRKTNGVCKLLDLCCLPHLEVYYESLVRDETTFQVLCHFLSIKFKGPMPPSRFVKIREASHTKIISNYAEVKRALARTEFARLIE
jgi:LPS sulfotransferase NodH